MVGSEEGQKGGWMLSFAPPQNAALRCNGDPKLLPLGVTQLIRFFGLQLQTVAFKFLLLYIIRRGGCYNFYVESVTCTLSYLITTFQERPGSEWSCY